MKKNLALLLGLLCVCLVAYFIFVPVRTKATFQPDTVMQIALGEQPWLRKAQTRLKPVVDAIIKEEMEGAGFADQEKYPLFVPKKRLVMTVYSLGRVSPKHELAVMNAIKNMQKSGAGTGSVHGLLISSDYAWFGDDATHFVVKIDDTEGALSKLRGGLRTAFIALNEQYTQKTGAELYSVKNAERFAFVPHVDLGRFIIYSPEKGRHWNLEPEKLTPEEQQVLENIKKRVSEAAPELLNDIDQERIIFAESYFLRGPKKGTRVDFPLKSQVKNIEKD